MKKLRIQITFIQIFHIFLNFPPTLFIYTVAADWKSSLRKLIQFKPGSFRSVATFFHWTSFFASVQLMLLFQYCWRNLLAIAPNLFQQWSHSLVRDNNIKININSCGSSYSYPVEWKEKMMRLNAFYQNMSQLYWTQRYLHSKFL